MDQSHDDPTPNLMTQVLVSMGLAANAASILAPAFVRHTIPKGADWVSIGQVADELGYVAEGSFIYLSDKDGDEITTYAVGQGGFIASLTSYLRGTPSQETIKALSPSVVYALNRSRQQALMAQHPAIMGWLVDLLEYQIICIDDSRLSHLLLTAEDRYLQLLAKDPDLLQLIPLKHLASLLGITPRHLSRLRSSIRH